MTHPIVYIPLWVLPATYVCPHNCFRLVILIPNGVSFVYSLPELQLLNRTAADLKGYWSQSVLRFGSGGKEALVIRALRKQLRVYQLPDLRLQLQTKLPGQAEGYGVSGTMF